MVSLILKLDSIFLLGQKQTGKSYPKVLSNLKRGHQKMYKKCNEKPPVSLYSHTMMGDKYENHEL